mmetsp:Transcript_29201/g.34404  ORF Transcript_29201/g.34404 Transcript_29201/m.34404 type:complete len:107 (-) Transcript_29201:77-397(-)
MNFKIAMASHNDDAEKILKECDIREYFDVVEGYDSDEKISHVTKILRELKVSASECVFFDDLSTMISEIQTFGINSVLVDHVCGICMDDLEKGGCYKRDRTALPNP